MSNATLYRRNGITFKIELVPACDPRPRGWELSTRDLEPGVPWSHLGLWKTKGEAITAMEAFAPKAT